MSERIGIKSILLRPYIKLLILFLIGFFIFYKNKFFKCDQWILLINGIAALFEGLFGFGGSLIFLSLTVSKLGWTGSVLLDCILASLNLSYVAFLNRKDLTRGVLFRCMRQYIIAIFGLGIGLFFFLVIKDPTVRVVPFIIFGLISCGYKAMILMSKKFQYIANQEKIGPWKSVFAVIAGIGIGASNQEAPSSDHLFRGLVGAIAFFISLLLIAKIGIISTIEGASSFSEISLINIIGYTFFGLGFTTLGDFFAGSINKISDERQERIKKLLEYSKLSVVFLAITYLSFQAVR